MKAPLIIKGKDNAKIQNAFSKSAFEIAHNSGPFNFIPVLSAKRESNILKCLSNCYWNTNSTPKNTIKGQIKRLDGKLPFECDRINSKHCFISF